MERTLMSKFPNTFCVGNGFSILLWLMLITFETSSQLAIKFAADITDTSQTNSQWIWALLTQPWFIVTIAFEVAGFFIWMSILNQQNLSLAVPLSSLSYFMIILTGTLVFHESISVGQWVSLLIIAAGIWLVATET